MKVDAGWYLDPTGAYTKRYWDGSRWTDHVQDADGTEHRAALASGESVVRVSMTSSAASSVPAASSSVPAASSSVPAASTTSTDEADPATASSATGFSAAVTGASTLSPATAEQRRASRRRAAETSDATSVDDTTAHVEPATSETGEPQEHSIRGAQVADARAMRTGALWLSLIAVALAVLPVLAPLGLVVAFVALLLGMVARRRLVNIGEVEQGGSVLAVLLAILAALVATIAAALFAVSFVSGDVARLVTCVGGEADAVSCVSDYFGVTWSRLR